MAFIETMPVATACDELRDLYAQQQAHWGYVPNYAKLFSHRPEALVRWGRLLAELRRPVSPRRFELVTLAAALELNSTPCALAHGFALAELCGEDTVRALAEHREAEVLDAKDVALVRYARTVARDATAVTEDQVFRLRALGFSAAEIFDVAALASARSFLTKMMDALGCLADSALTRARPRLTEALIVGRPTDPNPVERLPRP